MLHNDGFWHWQRVANNKRGEASQSALGCGCWILCQHNPSYQGHGFSALSVVGRRPMQGRCHFCLRLESVIMRLEGDLAVVDWDGVCRRSICALWCGCRCFGGYRWTDPLYAKVDGSGVVICWRCTVLLQEQTSRQIRQDSFLILLPMLRPFHHVLYLLSKKQSNIPGQTHLETTPVKAHCCPI